MSVKREYKNSLFNKFLKSIVITQQKIDANNHEISVVDYGYESLLSLNCKSQVITFNKPGEVASDT